MGNQPDLRSLDAYRRAGGYNALETAIRQQTPEQVIQQVLDAKLRGRGGAGRTSAAAGRRNRVRRVWRRCLW